MLTPRIGLQSMCKHLQQLYINKTACFVNYKIKEDHHKNNEIAAYKALIFALEIF